VSLLEQITNPPAIYLQHTSSVPRVLYQATVQAGVDNLVKNALLAQINEIDSAIADIHSRFPELLNRAK